MFFRRELPSPPSLVQQRDANTRPESGLAVRQGWTADALQQAVRRGPEPDPSLRPATERLRANGAAAPSPPTPNPAARRGQPTCHRTKSQARGRTPTMSEAAAARARRG